MNAPVAGSQQPKQAQLTESVQLLGAVVTALPFTSNTHGTLVLATAVPVTVTVILVPCGHSTSTLQTKFVEPPAGTVTVVGIGFPSRSTEQGRPTIATLRSALPVLWTVSEKSTGPLAVKVT